MKYKFKTRFFNNKKIARRFSLTFIFTGILGVLLLDKLIKIFFENNDITNQGPITFVILFMISTGIILYIMINHMQKVITKIEKSYNELKQKDKDRLAPYEFALDNSVDQIYWFTLDAKFVYVNQAACNILGYTKEEMLDMDLEDMDPNFDRNSAQVCMLEIKNTKNWRLETTQRKKDGTIIPIEVSGHGFIYGGKDYICAFGRDMTQRLEYRNSITTMNRELQKSIDEKEILLKEIHHRVKNNMEIISSLLNMQERRSNDNELKDAMKQSRSRIHTMALVHEFLYLGENLAYINLPDYITKLVEDIKDLYISQNTKLTVDLHIDKLIFSTNRCIQLGMVLHELCVNAFKYAFSENRDNLLCIHMNIIDDFILLKIRDNGDGMKKINSLYKSESIGMQLIHSIVEDQLDGEIEFCNNKGLECNIKFPQKENSYE
ncbi:sensor histidine kinase [Arcobacter sp. LA11]|uniref:sensor histidine kinase n=1 Tax=Arcobacter sp. LA11 TaxID=1898176 RepID=UPI0009349D18|nr:histidine kinase dimerization/phosphoacceptor domain -containing protein [Arcobacter sp. LA11]